MSSVVSGTVISVVPRIGVDVFADVNVNLCAAAVITLESISMLPLLEEILPFG